MSEATLVIDGYGHTYRDGFPYPSKSESMSITLPMLKNQSAMSEGVNEPLDATTELYKINDLTDTYSIRVSQDRHSEILKDFSDDDPQITKDGFNRGMVFMIGSAFLIMSQRKRIDLKKDLAPQLSMLKEATFPTSVGTFDVVSMDPMVLGYDPFTVADKFFDDCGALENVFRNWLEKEQTFLKSGEIKDKEWQQIERGITAGIATTISLFATEKRLRESDIQNN